MDSKQETLLAWSTAIIFSCLLLIFKFYILTYLYGKKRVNITYNMHIQWTRNIVNVGRWHVSITINNLYSNIPRRRRKHEKLRYKPESLIEVESECQTRPIFLGKRWKQVANKSVCCPGKRVTINFSCSFVVGLNDLINQCAAFTKPKVKHKITKKWPKPRFFFRFVAIRRRLRLLLASWYSFVVWFGVFLTTTTTTSTTSRSFAI